MRTARTAGQLFAVTDALPVATIEKYFITHQTSDQIDQTKQTNFDPKTIGVGGSDVSETVEKSNFLSLRMFICLNLKIYRLWPSAC